jgi:hypothetical protein
VPAEGSLRVGRAGAKLAPSRRMRRDIAIACLALAACERPTAGETTDGSDEGGDAASSTSAAVNDEGVGSSSSRGGPDTSGAPEPTSSSSAADEEEASTAAIIPDLGTDPRGTYATDFPLVEDPISEGGAWSAIASPWLRIRTIDGVAKADAYVTGYNDNYARLSGFGPDVQITATVYIDGPPPFGEVLLLARMADTATTLRGYEFLYDGDGSVQLMRWNGPPGDFTPMGGETANPGALVDGDQLRMRVVGNTITIFHRRPPDDWQQIGETTDDTFVDGAPGMGFFVRDEGQTIDGIGLHDWAVEEL